MAQWRSMHLQHNRKQPFNMKNTTTKTVKTLTGSGRLEKVVNQKVLMQELGMKIQPNSDSDNQDLEKRDLTKVLLLDSGTLSEYFINGKLSVSSLLRCEYLTASELVCSLRIIFKAVKAAGRSSVKILQQIVFAKSAFFLVVSILCGKKLAYQKFEGDDIFLNVVLHLLFELEKVSPCAAFEIMEVIGPLCESVLQQLPPVNDAPSILKCIQHWKSQKEIFFSTPSDESHQSDNVSLKDNCLPPSDFHSMSDIPDREEILSLSKPFLRPCIVNGPYQDVDQYLDIHFRLLREDLFHDFRKCLTEYFDGEVHSGNLYYNAHIENAYCGRNDVVWKFCVPVFHRVNWETTKKLTPGSLVCISSDNFAHFAFASIEDRTSAHDRSNACVLHLSFLDYGGDYSVKNIVNYWNSYDIIETNTFFEGCRYVLSRLKSKKLLSSFPLGNCLINFDKCSDSPGYMKIASKYSFLRFLKPKIYENILADIKEEHQCAAFEMALKNKVALIQGPPGTGKSYLGVQLAKCLIGDNTVRKPLVLMCYTNHALDQFCEKLLPVTQKIVRIGGRSKSSALKFHNLEIIVNAVNSVVGWKRVNKKRRDESYLNDMDWFEAELQSNEELVEEFVNRSKFSSFDEFYEAFVKAEKILGGCVEECERLPYSPAKLRFENVLEQINELTYPFRTAAKGYRIFDRNTYLQLASIKFLSGSKGTSKRNGTYSIEEIISMWLCIAPEYSDVYLRMTDFRIYLATSVIVCMESGIKLTGEGETLLDDDVKKLFLKLCDYDTASEAFRKSWGRRMNYDRNGYQTSLFNFINSRLTTPALFRLLHRSALYCCEKQHLTVKKQNKNVWRCDILQRWCIFNEMLQTNFCKTFSDLTFDGVTKSPFLNSHEFSEFVSLMKSCRDEQCTRILSHVDVIGITTSGCTKNWDLIESLKPTTFIVEEAAEVLESHIAMSLATSTEHLILIGDHLQLRPSPNVYNLAVKYNLDVSLFERLFKNGVPSVTLKTQHRMRPCISQLLVPEFYPELFNHPSVEEYEDVKGVVSNMFFIQHSEFEDEDEDMKSHSNLHEALFIVSLCSYLIMQGNEPDHITILTTYVGQLRVIRELLTKRYISVHSTTVDNFQGEENDIILLSFVRSNKESVPGFIKTANRICVALSRAKRGMFCIGNFEMFSKHSTTWVSLIEKLKKTNSFGERFQVCCKNHPTNKCTVRSSQDLERVMKRGCKIMCSTELECNHLCSLSCHFNERHQCGICEKESSSEKKTKIPGSSSEKKTINTPVDVDYLKQNVCGMEISENCIIATSKRVAGLQSCEVYRPDCDEKYVIENVSNNEMTASTNCPPTSSTKNIHSDLSSAHGSDQKLGSERPWHMKFEGGSGKCIADTSMARYKPPQIITCAFYNTIEGNDHHSN